MPLGISKRGVTATMQAMRAAIVHCTILLTTAIGSETTTMGNRGATVLNFGGGGILSLKSSESDIPAINIGTCASGFNDKSYL
jgi:hypothetical protein